MKSRDSNPHLATQRTTTEVTPGVDEQANSGGRVQSPISVSEGDFSTPLRRKRTITRPRGLKTIEQLALSQSAEAPKPVSSPVADPYPGTSGREASVVDEFLAAPPTPEPEVSEETPPPLVPLAPEALRFSEIPVDHPDGVAPERAAVDSSPPSDGDSAQPSGKDPARALPTPVPASVPAPAAEVAPDVNWSPAAAATPDAASLVGAPADSLESPPALTPDAVTASVVEDAQTAFSEAAAAESAAVGPADQEQPFEGVASEPETESLEEADLSPLAQTLANMAEAMRGELAGEGGVDIDIVDAPLVPAAVPPALPARAMPPPPPPAEGVGAPGVVDRRFPVPALVGLPEALAERPRRPRRSKPWYEEVFDETYLRTLPFMTAEQTLREVDFIESSLAVPKGAEVLDIACGYGRHAIELVQRGLAVTGVDLSLPLLIRAADESQRRAVSVNFVHTDMRELSFDRQFAGAYCMLTSFGYFDEESNLKVAEGISRALKPGGRFLLDVINRDYVVCDLPARVWWEGDGCVVLEEVDFNFNTNRILTHRSVVFEDGQQLEQEISLRVYSLHELGKLLRQAGFRVIEVSGSIPTRGHFFGVNSRNLLVLAERRAD